MSEVSHGVVHGRTIQLEEDPGIGDGQAVEVVLRPIPAAQAWGEGLRRCAGALADYPEMDQYLEEIQRERRLESRPELPE